MNQYPLIQITIHLGQNKTDQLILYRHTNPQQEASSFVQRNNLQSNMIQIISNSIIKYMQAYDEMMVITYDTQQQTNYLKNLKQNHLELQQKSKIPTPNTQKNKTQNQNISNSPQNHDDLLTDKVLIKKLFKFLDGDQDGLISTQKINFYNIPIQLQNKIQNKIENQSIPLQFEDFYQKLKEDPQEEYFQTLKLVSQIFNIPRIKVLI